MDEGRVRDLVRTYVTGWRDRDRERILSALTGDCEIIESHGPVYRGKDAVARWSAARHARRAPRDCGNVSRRHSCVCPPLAKTRPG
jgi:uncharacterized protein (TIGR02246 family)